MSAVVEGKVYETTQEKHIYTSPRAGLSFKVLKPFPYYSQLTLHRQGHYRPIPELPISHAYCFHEVDRLSIIRSFFLYNTKKKNVALLVLYKRNVLISVRTRELIRLQLED